MVLRKLNYIKKVTSHLRGITPQKKVFKMKQVGDLLIDPEEHKVIIEDEETFLPKKEFELLNLLTSIPGKVYRREEIFDIIWGYDTLAKERTIDVHIRKLRKKFGNDKIVTVKGVGYKFKA